MCNFHIKNLCGLLILILLMTNACVPKKKYLPQVLPARISPTDSRAYTTYLEKEKRYEELLRILNRELTTLQIIELYAKKGIVLTEQEKTAIVEYLKEQGSKNPINDFLKIKRLTPDTEHYDPEGEVFLLDYIAEIYTYGLVDFRKARKYNNKALALLEKLSDDRLQHLPVSDFYSNKRHLYFFVNCPTDEKGADKTPEKGLRKQELCQGAQDTRNFDQHTFNAVRKLDIEKIAARIHNRTDFINSKLGKPTRTASQEKPKRSTIASGKLLTHVEALIDSTEDYKQFQSFYLLASEAYKAYTAERNSALLPQIISYGNKALAAKPKVGLETQHKINFINYWVGYASLKIGNTDKGVAHMEKFFEGLENYEDFELENDKNRKALIVKVNQEQMESARKQAATQKTLAAITIIASVAGMAMSADAGPSGSSNIQQFTNYIGDGISIIGSANRSLQSEEMRGRVREKLTRYLSPYSLKVGRYLNKYEMIEYFFELGKGYHQQGNMNAAIRHYEEAIRIVELQRATILTEKERISFFGARQELYDRIIEALVESQRIDRALEFVERAKSRAFVDIMGTAKVALKSQSQNQKYLDRLVAQAEIETLAHSKALGSDQINSLMGKAKRAIQVDQKTARSDRAADLDIELISLSRVYTLKAYEIKSIIGSDTALIEYYLTKKTLFIFVVTPQKVKVVQRPIALEDLAVRISQWQTKIYDLNPSDQPGIYFYKLLVEPVKKYISGTERIIIIPHNVLNYLPFQALYDGNKFLIQKHSISYSPSATVLEIIGHKQSAGKNNALIVGNPTGDLKFAEQEAIQIGALFLEKEILTKKKATESNFKAMCGEYDYIHLATHGLYDPVHPMRSKILLSPDSSNDGLLTVTELFSIKLNANLVTLSACETGLSQNKTGDELIGLQRGLMFAGTRSIISSLWKVDDEATSYLMSSLYKNLKQMPKDKALQKAQLQTMKKFPNPYYWASFNLIGCVN